MQREEANPVLALEHITRRFGNVTALNDVTFIVKSGAVHALLGENGAGKTTLMRIAFGLLQPDAGRIMIDEAETKFRSPRDAIAAGIGMVHQQFSLIPAMRVAENVALGASGTFDLNDVADEIVSLGERTGLRLDPLALVENLSPADRQKLEILRTLAHNARLLILDEPTAVLTDRDTGELFDYIREFRNTGGSVVLITHKLRNALSHADAITVLRRGEVAFASTAAATDEQTLAAAMLGSASSVAHSPSTHAGSVNSRRIASLQGVVVQGGSRLSAAIDLELRTGEIVGVAALEGASEPLMRVLSRRTEPISGTVEITGSIGFVPENRADDGLVETFSLTENFALGDAASYPAIMDWPQIEQKTRVAISEFNVKPPRPEATPPQLSGGNQQRFILGRELSRNPDLLVLENPTQGLDVNAAAFVHARMRQAAARGAAVIFYSSDLDELAEQADRVVVLSVTAVAIVSPNRNDIGAALLSVSA